jgi:Domain of unknown function (DUF6268)
MVPILNIQRTRAGVLWLLTGLLSATAVAQSRCVGDEAGALSFVATGRVPVSDPSNEEASGEVSMLKTSLWMPFGQKDVGSFQFAAGIGVGWTRFEFDGFAGIHSEDLTSIGAPFLISRPVDEDWGGFISLMPVWNSDLQSGHSLGAKLVFHSAVEVPLNPTLRLSMGVAYDTAFGKNRWYPVGGVIWAIRPDLEMRMVLPSPTLYWTPSQDWGLFALAMPAGNQWSVFDEDKEEMVFQTESWRVGLGAERHLRGPCWLRLAGGMDINRQYEFSRDDVTEWESDVGDTWFVSAALVLYADRTGD